MQLIKKVKTLYGNLSLSKKINFFVLIITVITTALIGVFSYISFRNTSIKIIGGDALKIAETVTACVDGDKIQKYNETNQSDSSWDELTKTLSSIKAQNGAYFIYIMADDGDKYKYIAEGHIEGNKDDVTQLGDTDEKSIFGSEPQSVLNTGKAEYTDIYDNGTYGKLISGFTPIKNSQGKTVAVLGVDISANEAISSVNTYIPVLALLLIGCEILLVILLRLLLKKMIIKPLKDITVLEENIANGNNNIEIQENYLRQTDEIGDMFKGFKTMSDTFRQMLWEINNMAQQHKDGCTDVFIDEERFSGIYKQVVTSVNSTVKDYLNEILKIISYLDNISNGDFDTELEHFPGQKAVINEGIDQLKANLKNITLKMKELVTKAIDGDLQSRVDVGCLSGDWQKLMILLNNLLDAVVEPILEASEVLNELSEGNIETQVTGDYKGSYSQIKESLNRLALVIGNMTGDVKRLAASAIEGNLTVRADAGKYNGEYQKIIEYMNNTVDAVQQPISLIKIQLDQMAAGKPCSILDADFKGTYAGLVNSINALTKSISLMLVKTNSLMDASQKGDLAFRAGTDDLHGRYAEIVMSINKTLDAIIKPIEEIAAVIREISNGNLNIKVQGNYHGSLLVLKENVNLTVDTLNKVIQDISEYTANIAAGNIDLEELPVYNGDYNKISTDLNEIVSSLNDMLSNIWNSSEQIAAGSVQIAEGSRNLSAGTAEQSSSIEQLTASISQIASQTKGNARNASEAGNLANAAKDEVENGNGKMKEMLEAMNEINVSSQNITKIIKTIDEIAFQTNILALNAAVEAARAGQYGKGFTIVADEVRSLAVKSAQAAKSTDELIIMSNNKVKHGSEIVSQMAESLQKMKQSIEKVDELVLNIAEASKEQSTGINQINKGVEAVSCVVQSTVGTSEESAASSEELSGQAEMLKQMVGRFKLKS